MTVRPDVSVIIPVHNAGATVGRLVGSIVAVDEVAVEVVVVDDASTDDSLAQVTALGRPEVVTDGFATNRGAGVARPRRRRRPCPPPARRRGRRGSGSR